jgi:hypothetical protein
LAVLLLFTALHGLVMVQRVVPSDILSGYWPEFQASTIRLVVVGIMYIAVVSLGAVFLSHRAMGPLGRLEEELHNMTATDGPISELKVREGDDLEQVVHGINELIRKQRKS